MSLHKITGFPSCWSRPVQ